MPFFLDLVPSGATHNGHPVRSWLLFQRGAYLDLLHQNSRQRRNDTCEGCLQALSGMFDKEAKVVAAYGVAANRWKKQRTLRVNWGLLSPTRTPHRENPARRPCLAPKLRRPELVTILPSRSRNTALTRFYYAWPFLRIPES